MPSCSIPKPSISEWEGGTRATMDVDMMMISGPPSLTLELCPFLVLMAIIRYKHITGEKHRSYASTLNNLGLVYLAQAVQSQSKVQQMGLFDR